MKLDLRTYHLKSDWINAATADIYSDIKRVLAENDQANVLLSGGGTPGPIYEQMAREIEDFNSINLGLVDERFVPVDSEFSNERLIKDAFSKAKETTIVGMVQTDKNEQENLNQIRELYAPFRNRTDVIILGMGGDGHTASIFPSDPNSMEVLKNGAINLFSTCAPVEPKKRITCSMELISRATYIYLLIAGEQKLKVLRNNQMRLPIHNLFERRSDVKIFYLEK